MLEVQSGLDRGLRAVAGHGELRLPDLPCAISFSGGHATLRADAGVDLALGAQPIALPIVLLHDDRITLGPHRIEVVR